MFNEDIYEIASVLDHADFHSPLTKNVSSITLAAATNNQRILNHQRKTFGRRATLLRSTRVVNLAISFLIPVSLFAQFQRDAVPVKSWPAPLYWQPSPSEA